jgi:hypothetical protein
MPVLTSFSYVLKYEPPSTGRLVQQLSVPLPQLVMPSPPGSQLWASFTPLSTSAQVPLGHAPPSGPSGS